MVKLYCRGTARIKDKVTGIVYDIECAELQWDESADDRKMGPETLHEAKVEHPNLGTLVWSLWEYPQGVENDRKTDVNGHEIVTNIDFGLEHIE
jgi:hypothetical protein